MVNGYADLASQLRAWIVDAELQPGTPLPKHSELAAHYAVSGPTMTRAMRELQDDGFVVAIRRAGSFVADQAPHLFRYGLVLPTIAGAHAENRYLHALKREAERLSSEGEFSLVCFHDVAGDPTSAGRRRLEQDLARQRLAGLIYATPPFLLRGSAILGSPGVARVAVMERQEDFPQVAAVRMPQHDLARRAMARFAELGRRRVAVLANVRAAASWDAWVPALAAEYGLESRPEWLQACHIHSAECGRRMLRLLMSAPADSRPDAVIITDDNLVAEATLGIADSGVTAPGEVTVIGHCNFPWPTSVAVPVTWLGFDAGETLSACMRALQAQQRGEGIPPLAEIPAIFAAEYDARRSGTTWTP